MKILWRFTLDKSIPILCSVTGKVATLKVYSLNGISDGQMVVDLYGVMVDKEYLVDQGPFGPPHSPARLILKLQWTMFTTKVMTLTPKLYLMVRLLSYSRSRVFKSAHHK